MSDKREIIAIGRRIKERKYAELQVLSSKHHNEAKQQLDANYEKVCRPLAIEINRTIQKTRKRLVALYGEQRISDYRFPNELNLKQTHEMISTYSADEQKRLDAISAKYSGKQVALVAAFDDFEMAVLTENADGALKAFIKAIEKL